MAGEAWDTLHDPGTADEHWSTDNVGEAAPGVLTPLSWSFWGRTGDRMPREIAFRMGIFSPEDRRTFPRIVRVFHGRIAIRMEYLAAVGDRMPGATGPEAVANMLGRVPETMRFAPTASRYPAVAAKLPRAIVSGPREVRRRAPIVDAWWRSTVLSTEALDAPACRQLLARAAREFDECLTSHSLALLAVVQPLLVELTKLVDQLGVGDVGVLGGSGGAEMAIIEDIWAASRGALTLDDVVARHGFHGPVEGEISSRVWREDPAPLERLVARYADESDGGDPIERRERAARELPAAQRAVLAAVPAARRPATRALLALAARNLPLRGVGKRSFLQSLDVGRAAARRLGELTFDDPDDVFYLTLGELTGRLPADAADLIAKRRARRAEYEALELPADWQGSPDQGVRHPDPSGPLTGIAASRGVVEGRARVVLDPSFAEVEPDEVLVAATTDPSWASIMFISAALVVDIGGELSHAAVVARELGIPCVVNTRTGTRTLKTGDLVRVDGTAGTVEILEEAP